MMIAAIIIIGWIICGAFAYALTFGWWVNLVRSYPLAYEDRNIVQVLREQQWKALTLGFTGPIGLLAAVLVTATVCLPQRRPCYQWRNPAKAMMVLRALQRSSTTTL